MCLARLRRVMLAGAVSTAFAMAAAPTIAQDGISIAGRVLDAAGKGKADAVVTLAVEPDEHRDTALLLGGKTGLDPVVTVSVEVDGTFAIAAPEIGLWRLSVAAPGFVPMRTRILPLLHATAVPSVRLLSSVLHAVLVQGPEGEPLPSAWVWAVSNDERWWDARINGWRTGNRLVRSDQDGVAVLPRAVGEALEIHAFAPGLVAAEVKVAGGGETKGGSETTIRLRAGVSADVIFEDHRGRPLAGAAVRVGAARVPRARRAPLAMLGADGRATFTGLPGMPLTYTLTTRAGARDGGTVTFGSGDGEEVLTRRVPKPTVVVGQVVEAATQRPVAGALVWNPRDPGNAGRTDERGDYRMVVNDVSELGLRAAAAGYARGETQLVPEGPGRTVAPTIVLGTAVNLAGRVVDTEGLPIAGAEIILRPRIRTDERRALYRAADDNAFPRGTSAEDGRFQLESLSPGLYSLIAQCAAFAPAVVEQVEILRDQAVTDVGEVRLDPAVALEGLLVDQEGEPIAGARVHWRSSLDHLPVVPDLWRILPNREDLATDEAGGFRIELASGAMVKFDIEADDFVKRFYGPIMVPTDEPIRIVLEAGATVAGVVLDPRGAPLPGASIRVVGRVGGTNKRVGYGAADADGAFEIIGLRAGTLSVRAEVRDRGIEPVIVEGIEMAPGERRTDLCLMFDDAVTLVGVVTDPEGRPLAGARVSGTPSRKSSTSRATARTVTDGDGWYRLAFGPTALVQVYAGHGRFLSTRRKVDLEPGEQRLDLVLERGDRGHAIRGVAIGADDAPLQGARVFARGLRGERGPEQQAPFTGDAGRFAIEGLPNGIFRLEAQHSDLTLIRSPPVIVENADVEDVLLRFERGETTLVGRIRGLSGAERSRVEVYVVRPAFPPSRSGKVDLDGGFRVLNLQPGRWLVAAGVETTARAARAWVDVPTGAEEVAVELVFEESFTLTGRVTLDDEPLAKAFVVVVDQVSGAIIFDMVGPDGEFRFEGLGPGSVMVNVSSDESKVNAQRRLELTGDLDFPFDIRSHWLTGRVVDTSGQALAGVRVVLAPLTDVDVVSAKETFLTGADGTFRAVSARGGRHEVRVQHEGYQLVRRVVALAAGHGSDPIELVLESAASLTLPVRRADGSVPDLVTMHFLDPAGHVIHNTYSRVADGVVRLSMAVPGPGLLAVAARGTVSVTIPLPAAADLDVLPEVILPPGAMLEVRVPALTVTHASGVVLTVRAPDGTDLLPPSYRQGAAAHPFTGGRTSIQGLIPGIWIVEVTTDSGQIWQTQIDATIGAYHEAVLE